MQLDLDREEITELLRRWGRGDDDARNAMFDKVYEKLCAAVHAAAPRQGESLMVSVVHEAFLRLSDYEGAPFRDRTHFAGFCAQTLRHLLIDRHRRSDVRRRNADPAPAAAAESADRSTGRFDVGQALSELTQVDAAAADAITLKVWAGLSVKEIADFGDCSVATAGRNLKRARFFLKTRLQEFTDTSASDR